RLNADNSTHIAFANYAIKEKSYWQVAFDGSLTKPHESVAKVAEQLIWISMGAATACATTETTAAAVTIQDCSISVQWAMDNPKFDSSRDICMFGVKRKPATAFHPPSDGQAEGTNRESSRIWKMALHDFNGTRWKNMVPNVQLAYSSARHHAHGMSPLQAPVGTCPQVQAALKPKVCNDIWNLFPT
ncbi:hypothetical protein AMAG_20790, partial [Allomyces macrogynus ATCC 38327]